MASPITTWHGRLVLFWMRLVVLGALVLLWSFEAVGAGNFVGGDGVRYDRGEWSPPQAISLASATGQVASVRTTVTITNGPDNVHMIERIYAPTLQTLWMGAGYTNHFVMGTTIYGARMYAHQLLVRPSEVVDNSNRVDVVATNAFARLLSKHENLRGDGRNAPV